MIVIVEKQIRKRQAREVLVGAPVAAIVWLLLIRLIGGTWSFGFPVAIMAFSGLLSALMVGPEPLATFAYRFWKGLLFLIDWIVSRVVCLVLYYLLITPMGILLRLFRVRLLNLKDEDSKASQWRKVSPSSDPRRQYFRQF